MSKLVVTTSVYSSDDEIPITLIIDEQSDIMTIITRDRLGKDITTTFDWSVLPKIGQILNAFEITGR